MGFPEPLRRSRGEDSMDEDKVALIEKRWRGAQKHLGFTDDELRTFRKNPAHKRAMENAPCFATMQMVVEVVEAHNCAAGYKAGDRFVVDAEGLLVTESCPQRLCVGAVYSFKPLVDRMWQAFFDNSIEILHDTVRCPDVGVHNGGAGSVTMKIHAEPREGVKDQQQQGSRSAEELQ
jgi:uncharacterized repeat protein (TIGR04076 family)